MIPYGRQCISRDDIDAVNKVLQSDWLTQGPVVPRFEEAVTRYVGAEYGVAVNSATSALHVACLALELGPSDILWTSCNTFVASANCAVYCGADVDFIDIDPRTYNIRIDALKNKLEVANSTNSLPKIIVTVHFAGQSCEMKAIKSLSDKYGFSVIEDASHAIGARYLGEPVGNCCYSDITVFSFHPVKIITTGEGGMAVTNSENHYERMLRLRSHGITRDSKYFAGRSTAKWYYQQIELGYNYRMTDIQAALGLSQMDRIDQFIASRRRLALRYNELLSKLDIILPWQHADCESAWHLYVIRVVSGQTNVDRGMVFDSLRLEGIGVQVHYIPVHTQPFYQKRGFRLGDYPECEHYYEEALSLPIFPALTNAEQDKIVIKLYKILS